MRRRNGLQSPLSGQQIAAATLQLLFTVLGIYVSAVLPAELNPKIAAVSIYGILGVAVISCWLYCEIVDPALPGGIPCICMRKTQSQPPRYCRINNKYVPGMDHHCVWLNTAIGTRNYFSFYMLSLTATLQHIFQLVIAILLLTSWRDSIYEDDETYLGLMIAYCVILTGPIVSFGTLLGFHSYLLTKGIGTYDWLIQRAEASTSSAQRDAMERARRRATERETREPIHVHPGLAQSSPHSTEKRAPSHNDQGSSHSVNGPVTDAGIQIEPNDPLFPNKEFSTFSPTKRTLISKDNTALDQKTIHINDVHDRQKTAWERNFSESHEPEMPLVASHHEGNHTVEWTSNNHNPNQLSSVSTPGDIACHEELVTPYTLSTGHSMAASDTTNGQHFSSHIRNVVDDKCHQVRLHGPNRSTYPTEDSTTSSDVDTRTSSNRSVEHCDNTHARGSDDSSMAASHTENESTTISIGDSQVPSNVNTVENNLAPDIHNPHSARNTQDYTFR